MSNLRKKVRKAGGLILCRVVVRHGQKYREIVGETATLPHHELVKWWRNHRQMIENIRRCAHRFGDTTYFSRVNGGEPTTDCCGGCGLPLRDIAALSGGLIPKRYIAQHLVDDPCKGLLEWASRGGYT